MKLTMRIAAALGLLLIVALVIHGGLRDIAGLLANAGRSLLWLVPLHLLPLLLDALGWRRLLTAADVPATARGPLRLL